MDMIESPTQLGATRMRCEAPGEQAADHVPVRWLSKHNLFACTINQPLQDSIEIRFFLCADAVAADLSVQYFLQVQRVDELVNGQFVGQVGFVSQHEEGNTF
jgi:hypothetical protein